MPKKQKSIVLTDNPAGFYATRPWESRHYKDHSDLIAYIEKGNCWETIATINRMPGTSAESLANFMCNVINDYQKNKNVLLAAMEALELCLEDSALTFSSEQAAERAVSDIKQVI